jgi:GrpB-like predicted nucleotidyltransferase (UPF0157 family)
MLVRVEVVTYDPDWPTKFEVLRQTLSQALAGVPVVGIEHVGSTAVPGLAAKPVIDIDIVVTEAYVEAAITALAGIGYTNLGEMGVPARYALAAPDDVIRRNVRRRYRTAACAKRETERRMLTRSRRSVDVDRLCDLVQAVRIVVAAPATTDAVVGVALVRRPRMSSTWSRRATPRRRDTGRARPRDVAGPGCRYDIHASRRALRTVGMEPSRDDRLTDDRRPTD